MEGKNELIEKYNISEQDLYTLGVIEEKKSTAGWLDKEKLKAKSMGVLKPYNVKFMDLGNLLSAIKAQSLHTDQTLRDKYGDIEIENIKSSGLTTGIIIAVVVILVVIGAIVGNKKAEMADAYCYCNVQYPTDEYPQRLKCLCDVATKYDVANYSVDDIEDALGDHIISGCDHPRGHLIWGTGYSVELTALGMKAVAEDDCR